MNIPVSDRRSPDFSQYCGKLVAVVLRVLDPPVVFRGHACCAVDKRLGKILAVSEDSAAADSTRVILTEAQWQGRIVSGANYGCQYCFIPAADNAHSG